jgi:hypothetical protein
MHDTPRKTLQHRRCSEVWKMVLHTVHVSSNVSSQMPAISGVQFLILISANMLQNTRSLWKQPVVLVIDISKTAFSHVCAGHAHCFPDGRSANDTVPVVCQPCYICQLLHHCVNASLLLYSAVCRRASSRNVCRNACIVLVVTSGKSPPSLPWCCCHAKPKHEKNHCIGDTVLKRSCYMHVRHHTHRMYVTTHTAFNKN